MANDNTAGAADRLRTAFRWLAQARGGGFPACSHSCLHIGSGVSGACSFLPSGLPIIFAASGAFRVQDRTPAPLPDGLSGLALRLQIISSLDAVLRDRPISGKTTGCLVVQFDDADAVAGQARARRTNRSVDPLRRTAVFRAARRRYGGPPGRWRVCRGPGAAAPD